MTPAALFMRRAERTASLGSIVLSDTNRRARRDDTVPLIDFGLTASATNPRRATPEKAQQR
jgi:hypothetical protein